MSLLKVDAVAPDGCIIVYDFIGLEYNVYYVGAMDANPQWPSSL